MIQDNIGFFVAREKAFYKEAGIELDIIDPSEDDYAVTPAKKVELGQADFALCPTESVISYRTKSKPFDLIGVATIFQEDLSAIAVKSNSGISSPKDLDGKSYASYQARYEDGIVKQMIKNDGGEGKIAIDYPKKLGIWDTLLEGSFDSTWIFLNWEGVEAESIGAQLNYFRMEDYGIPYSYSPLLVASESRINSNIDLYKKFMAATTQGHDFARDNQAEAVELFKPFVPKKDEKIDLSKALEISAAAFGENWGKMEKNRVHLFIEWLHQKGLETAPLVFEDLVYDGLLP